MNCHEVAESIFLGFEIVHNNRFVYDHDDYECALPIFKSSILINPCGFDIYMDHPFKVYCPHCHRYFETTIRRHLVYGYGCTTCPSIRQIGSRRRAFRTKQFVEKAVEIHGDRYDYSRSYWSRSIDGVFIVCPDHGQFVQTPQIHCSKKCGCRQCAFERISNYRLNDLDYFIKISQKKHGNKYDYSMSKYNGYSHDISIICPIHGEFRQKAGVHMQGSGCRQCNLDNRFDVPLHPNRSEVASYDKFRNKLVPSDRPTKGSAGELLVACKYCGKLFAPSKRMVYHRLVSTNATEFGEHNFYCSNECKTKCPVFYKSVHSDISKKSKYWDKVRLARKLQLITKKTLLNEQIEDYGYNFCERCGRPTDKLDLHHTIEVAKDPDTAINIDTQMLVCRIPCHKELSGKHCHRYFNSPKENPHCETG